MYGNTVVQGIVIKSINIGEFDKRITILTRDRGKIGAFVRGARRPSSQLMGASRLFSFGEFTLYEGRDAYNLQNANISKYFDEISSDIENTCYATYFAEMADYYAKEYLNEPDLLKLIYVALLAINNKNIPNKLVRRIFELRAMVIGGEYEPFLEKASDACNYTWDFIIHTPIEKLFKFTLKDTLFDELASNIDRNISKFIDKKMNSLDILEAISI